MIGTAWGVTRYVPENYASAQAFLALFFVFYVAIALLYARQTAPRLTHYVDGTLVFGTPLAAFGLQYGLIHEMRFGLAFSALAPSALTRRKSPRDGSVTASTLASFAMPSADKSSRAAS